MITKFEHFAASSLMGGSETLPRSNGDLLFKKLWEDRAMGLAITLSKKGHYEWESFRQELITSIAEWEASHCKDDPSWDYYERWLLALERIVIDSSIISSEEWDSKTKELLNEKCL
ncbi:nitrile hydratase accessory protein [Paenibacillus abyssi]|uniref:Nitrile hydratase beta subunit-like N-terminal domain-containing protein n=1 Tax=Paenibacillus abyssi TaxID=1340531 RepID=A0A917G592_9BACL|nr:nitrile hydratase accessory protein [Paenibacillus abyssi]GGG22488.1 hypothetical protein GCM10010916_43930 [Paenibacillus abyssi]